MKWVAVETENRSGDTWHDASYCHLDGIQSHPEDRPMGMLVTENGKDHSVAWGPELSLKEERS